MTDLSNMTLAELENFKCGNTEAIGIWQKHNEEIDAEIERRKSEPDYAAWEPKWQAFREEMGWQDTMLSFTKEHYIRALFAAHNTPLAGEDWIPWAGGECPVHQDALVDLELRSGDFKRSIRAKIWYWYHAGERCDIIAYRVVKQTDEVRP
ncbi:MAG: hypothetical protein NUV75_00540 [Gallionella sp.]|nr:hypothetical protein [Gallionella sp.]